MDQVRILDAVNVQNTLPKVMRLNRMSTNGLAEQMNYSSGLVSKMCHGKTPLHFDQLEQMLDIFLKPSMLVFDFMNKATHLIPPLANGTKFHKEPDTIACQLLDEVSEATQALYKSMDEFRSDDRIKDLSDPEEAVKQMLDVELLINTLKVAIENDYDGISIQHIEIEREKYWKMHHYTK